MVVHEGWTDSPVHPALMSGQSHTLTWSQAWEHTHELTFRQGVCCIEIPPPFHLI